MFHVFFEPLICESYIYLEPNTATEKSAELTVKPQKTPAAASEVCFIRSCSAG